MRDLGTALMLFAAVALILFPPCYHLRTRGRWLRTPGGPHLMSFMGVLGLVMCFAVANVALDLPSWVRPLVWFLIGVVSWWRLGLLFTVANPKDVVCAVCGRDSVACGFDADGNPFVHLLPDPE